jgi:hypothetical protein
MNTLLVYKSECSYLPTLMPVIVLQMVEEQLLPLRQVMLSVVFLCADKYLYNLILRIFMAERTNSFPQILCYFSFSVF